MENILLKKCRKCKEEKLATVEYFYRNKNIKGGLHKWCKDCSIKFDRERDKTPKRKDAKRKWSKIFYRTLEGRLRRLITVAKERFKDELEFDIDLPWVMSLWNKQDGCCLLTGIKFDLEPPDNNNWKSNPYAPSLDRIDSSKGYTKDNVRLVIHAINTSFNEWGEDIFIKISKKFLNQISKTNDNNVKTIVDDCEYFYC